MKSFSMNKLVLLSGLLVFILQNRVVAQSGSKALYLRKVESYHKMKNTGTALGVAGGILTITGIVLVSDADWHKQTYGAANYTTADSKGVVGVLSIVVGIPMVVGGIVLGSVGSRKMKEYQQKLYGLSFNPIYTPQQRGIVLTYRF